MTKRYEDLLEAIHEISEKKGYAKSRDIAQSLNITPATVTDGFKRLSEAGLANYEPYGGVTLTDAGKEIAIRTQDSHNCIKELLEMAGVPEDTADTDACIMEHGLSETSKVALKNIVTFLKISSDVNELKSSYLELIASEKKGLSED